MNVVFEEIHCIGNPKDGFRFGQVVWNDATTVDGVGPDGPGSAWAMRTGRPGDVRVLDPEDRRQVACGQGSQYPAATPHTSGSWMNQQCPPLVLPG
ncbi:MAG: hypothetical protein ACLTYN_04795 [Dysosmobacter welbionis]